MILFYGIINKHKILKMFFVITIEFYMIFIKINLKNYKKK